MAELEVHTHHGEHGENPLILPVSLTMSILAVLVAVATLFGHRAHTEELLLQAQATDQWAYYQAKNIRLHEMQVMVDQLGVFAVQDKEKTELLREKYQMTKTVSVKKRKNKNANGTCCEQEPTALMLARASSKSL